MRHWTTWSNAVGPSPMTLPLSGDGSGTDRGHREFFADPYTGTLCRAALHVWTVAAVDQTLRGRIIPLERQAGRDMHRLALQLLDVDDSDLVMSAWLNQLDVALGQARGRFPAPHDERAWPLLPGLNYPGRRYRVSMDSPRITTG